jgi:AGZA family xanthine/uracil permease-like MFS transporter
MLEKIFRLSSRNTSVRIELIAGATTFLSMAYILFLNPSILSSTGMDKDAVFFATVVSSGLVTIAMGLVVNIPVALAPGMGLNALFATVAAVGTGMPWPTALGAVFISGLIFILLTVINVRQLLVKAVPDCLKSGITVGIGLFIALIGLKLSEVMVVAVKPLPATTASLAAGQAHTVLRFFEWDIRLGSFHNPALLLCLIGLFLSVALMTLRVRGALLIGILAAALVGIPMGVTQVPHDFSPFRLPSLSHLAVGALDIQAALKMGFWSVVFTFTFIELFDSFGTLVGTLKKAGLADQPDSPKIVGKAMLVDALGVSFGAFMGTSTLTCYIESASGISEGGKTGLTAVTTGLLFLLTLFIGPLAQLIPDAATAPALIIVGVLMVSTVKEIDFTDLTEGFPAFMTFIIMPFTYGIANGISMGIVSYTVLKLLTGKARQVHWVMYILMVLVLVRYVYVS